MNIVYVSSGCSEEKFENLRKQGITRKLPQAQKYHQLMVEGIACSSEETVDVISAIPTNRSWSKKIFFHGELEKKETVIYHYIPFVNIPLLSQVSKYYAAKRIIKRICKSKKNVAIVCDVLNQSIAAAARNVGNYLNIPVVGIVTDVPGHTSGARRKSYSFLKRKVADFAEQRAKNKLSSYKAFLFLTEAMNDAVNPNHFPYIVIEGQSDYKMIETQITKKSIPKVAMYAGGIHREFGIERMVNAFLEIGYTGWELHIYGDGNFQSELKKIAETNDNVKYYGVVSNDEVKKAQLRASILLNPRLTDAEYVKYSFPSKTMECMASGTPLLTTKLPSMPKDYYPYVYFFEDESIEGMKIAFQKVLNITDTEMRQMGSKAKLFVLNYKNNKIQARKLIDFIKTLKTKDKYNEHR